MEIFPPSADMPSLGLRRVTANPRAYPVGGIVGGIREYLAYCERERNENRTPVDIESWRDSLRAENDRIREYMRMNHGDAVMPNVTESRPYRYRVNSLVDTPVMLGDRTANKPATKSDAKRSRSHIELPIATYLLSLPKSHGLPIMVNADNTVDNSTTLLLLMIYRMLIATDGGSEKNDRTARIHDRNSTCDPIRPDLISPRNSTTTDSGLSRKGNPRKEDK